MWKEIIEFIKSASKEKNNEELMTYYIEYIIPFNPLLRVKNSPPNRITDDILKIQKIILGSSNSPNALEKICKQKFRSIYITNKIQECKDAQTGMTEVNKIIEKAEKYIEMTFILRSIEKLHNYERIKSIVATLLAILTLVVTIKISIIKIGI